MDRKDFQGIATGSDRTPRRLNGDYYQARDPQGLVGGPCSSVSEVVRMALCEDGHSVRFVRDNDGVMRCFTSGVPVGGPGLRHEYEEAWPSPYDSRLPDDEAAIAAICEAIMLNATRCHDLRDIWIDIDTYVDDELISTNFVPLSTYLESADEGEPARGSTE